MCMMKCPQQHFESTLKRYLTPVEEIMRAFCTNNMLPLTSDAHMQHFLNRLKNTNMYEKFGLHIPEHYRENYLHASILFQWDLFRLTQPIYFGFLVSN